MCIYGQASNFDSDGRLRIRSSTRTRWFEFLSRTSRYLLSSDSATPWSSSRAARKGQSAWKEGNGQGKKRGAEKLFDQVSVNGKLNQIGLDKATRIRGYMNHALLPDSFPLFFKGRSLKFILL